jgi:addiction module RelE/StbE family toxin
VKEIRYKKAFIKKFKALPRKIQEEFIRLEKVLKENPFHPCLHTKGLHGKLRNFYSFRITRDYRVVFEFISENEIGLITAEHRKDIYREHQ